MAHVVSSALPFFRSDSSLGVGGGGLCSPVKTKVLWALFRDTAIAIESSTRRLMDSGGGGGSGDLSLFRNTSWVLCKVRSRQGLTLGQGLSGRLSGHYRILTRTLPCDRLYWIPLRRVFRSSPTRYIAAEVGDGGCPADDKPRFSYVTNQQLVEFGVMSCLLLKAKLTWLAHL